MPLGSIGLYWAGKDPVGHCLPLLGTGRRAITQNGIIVVCVALASGVGTAATGLWLVSGVVSREISRSAII